MGIKKSRVAASRARQRAKQAIDHPDLKKAIPAFQAYIRALDAHKKELERAHAKAITSGKQKSSEELGKKIRDIYKKIGLARKVIETLERVEKGEHKKPGLRVAGEQFGKK